MKSDNARAWLSYAAAALLAAGGFFLLPMLFAGMELTLIEYYMLNAVQQLFLFVAPSVLILRAREARWQHFKAQLRKLSVDTTGYCMLLAVACTVVISLAVALWLPIVENTLGHVPEQTPLPDPKGAAQWLTALVCIAVVPAAAEELFFRGFVQNAVSKYFPRAAAAGTALFFAALHLDIASLPGLFLMGYLLGKTMERRGIFASMLLHAVYNAAVLLINARGGQIGSAAVWLCIFAFFFAVRRLLREEENHAADGTGM